MSDGCMGISAYDPSGQVRGYDGRDLTSSERSKVIRLGNSLAKKIPDEWLIISGAFDPDVECQVKALFWEAFGYPELDSGERDLRLNVLLDSPGGDLDSAYRIALYLAQYAKSLHVYVPDRAKSASTLLVVGADKAYLSAFGELGPLDSQIPDPRNPANMVSALDCYQSVDYVADFGLKTIGTVLPKLVNMTERLVPVADLLDKAMSFSLGGMTPMLDGVIALDFGGWARGLRVGEHYACQLLLKATGGDEARARRIAEKLVFGYTHHSFPIDYDEARRIELDVAKMSNDVYRQSSEVVKACNKKRFVRLLSKKNCGIDPTQGRDDEESLNEHGLDSEPVKGGGPKAQVRIPRPMQNKGQGTRDKGKERDRG